MSADLGDRKTYLGATDVPCVAGLSPYKNALGVYLEKVGEAEPFEGNLATRIGLAMEPTLSALYEERTGNKVREIPEVRHREHDFIRAHLDRVAPDAGRVVELKTVDPRNADRWGAEGSDEVPTEYLGQVQVQMALAGLPVADIAAAFGNRAFRIYTVPFDAELAEGLITIAVRFWRKHVAAKVPPPIDGSDIAAEWLARRYPKATGSVLPAPENATEWARRLRDAKARKHAAEKEESEARNKLMELIGANKGFEGEWGRVQWINNKGRAVTNWKALADELRIPAEVIEKHTTRAPYRVLTAKFNGETTQSTGED